MVSKLEHRQALYPASFSGADAIVLQVLLKQHPDTKVSGRSSLSLHGAKYPAGIDGGLCYDCYMAERATYLAVGDSCNLWAESETARVRVYGISCREHHGVSPKASAKEPGPRIPRVEPQPAPEPPKAEPVPEGTAAAVMVSAEMGVDEFIELAKAAGAKRIAFVWL